MSRFDEAFATLISETMTNDDAAGLVMPLYADALPPVLKDEGGYVNHPRDPGGATNYGVTQHVYDAWRHLKGLQPRSVRAIGMEEVRAIYKEQYWDRVRGDDLPAGLDYCTFDYAVNSGPPRAIRGLQDALGVATDGLIGAVTLATAQACDAPAVIGTMCDRRLAWLRTISGKDGRKLWGTFGRGWAARLDHVRATAIRMAREGASQAPAGPAQPVPPSPVPLPPPVAESPQASGAAPARPRLTLGAVMAGIAAFLTALIAAILTRGGH